MRVLIAAGGTAGHINPALAIAGALKQADPAAEIHFAGRREGMEYGLVTKAGYPFHHIEINGFQRRLTPENIRRNLLAAYHLALSGPRTKAILKQVQPDLVIGCGGYVSGPVVRAAAKRGIRTAIHEQNAFPGVTNKLLAKDVDVVFAASADAVEKLGARRINEVVAVLCGWEQRTRQPIVHLHATGSRGVQLFEELAKKEGFTPGKGLVVREYIDNMPELLAAADLVIARSGALTLAELEVMGRASILIPSPNVAENHQYYNALELQKAGAAVVIEEKDLNGERLIKTVQALMAEPGRLAEMGRCARTLAVPDSLDRITARLLTLVKTGH